MTVVPYRPLDTVTLESIVEAKLEKLRERYKTATGKPLELDEDIVETVLGRCASTGVRDIENLLMGEVVGKLAEWVLK